MECMVIRCTEEHVCRKFLGGREGEGEWTEYMDALLCVSSFIRLFHHCNVRWTIRCRYCNVWMEGTSVSDYQLCIHCEEPIFHADTAVEGSTHNDRREYHHHHISSTDCYARVNTHLQSIQASRCTHCRWLECRLRCRHHLHLFSDYPTDRFHSHCRMSGCECWRWNCDT